MSHIASDFGEKLNGTLDQVGALGRTAGKKLDEARLGTADALNDSASSVRDAGEAIDGLAERTAGRLDSTATYIRKHDSIGSFIDLRQMIRRHPASLVAGAAAFGFLVGIAIRNPWSTRGADPKTTPCG